MDITDAYVQLEDIARIGKEVELFLNGEAGQAAITLVRARIFEAWTSAPSPAIREELHAEQRALERLLEALQDLDSEGVVAREARRRMYDELGEIPDLPQPA
jgi:hypothetical protein